MWLLAIVADQAHKHHRRARPTLQLSEHLRDPSDPTELPMGIDLAAALGRLTERQRLAITLHYYLGLPVAETADVMACSQGTVKSTLSDARSRLRALLGEDYA